ncbi:tellurium resistance protein TerC [Lentzea flava]|uniref:Tellurium resistance protein TerC n=1 Tax=Lentzea flava TaxID=103732 RepID=A0ABQ2UDX9_9PSEU|nr:TerC family protein [Lentzea flava]MCP2198069.1 tellurite resistance protein TerC [Lentzea flava]GGU24450.1 tellurium resistance protein TerC [Lentzea flava]
MLDLPVWVWIATMGGLALVIAFDFYLVVRKPHEPSFRESVCWVVFYVGLAVLFGLGVTLLAGGRHGGEFFAGWITEYSLSVDNLFVFVLIMARFAVPREQRQKVLIVGILLALLLRAVFIAIGAEAISRFDWLFYVFGAFLIYTAWKLVAHNESEEAEFSENAALRAVRKVFPRASPLLIVMVAVGTTDLLFAVDSIPAIFGLTKEPYLVLTANAFALMGLRQLFFLVGGLLDRLVHLSKGLAVVLAFIGLKLILEAMHHHGVPWAPEFPIVVSLGVIVVTLAITTVWSLHTSRRAARAAVEEAEAQRSQRIEGAQP